MEHTVLDYSTWDVTGRGINIRPRLDPVEGRIWDVCFEYQDKRDDHGHAEIVTHFALVLTNLLNGNRRITIPAAIGHDTGYSQIPELVQDPRHFYRPIRTPAETEMRVRHEREGVALIRKVLLQIDEYQSTPEDVEAVCRIVDGHDTHEGFRSLEDGIVRDADKLWRFTLPCIKYSIIQHEGKTLAEAEEKSRKSFERPGFFYFSVSAEIARLELENTLAYYRAHHR
jgi:hypothetical protein